MKQDPFKSRLVDVVIPDLGAGGAGIQFVCWLVPRGASVIAGERIAELLTQGTVFQLESPIEGTLASQRVQSGAAVQEGGVVGRIRTSPPVDD